MKNYFKLLSVAGLSCLSGLALADDAAPPLTGLAKVLDESGVTATGYLSASYQTNFNDGSVLGGRAFDSKTDSFTFNQAALTISKLPAEGFGALVNVIVGDDGQVINGSYGDGNSKFSLTQAFVQYATGGLTVIGGRYVTLAGWEVINEVGTPHISRSFLFQNAEPLVHTGVRASYKFSDFITAYAGVNNSAVAGFATDNNKQKTGEFGVAITPFAPLTIAVYDYYGFDSSGKTNFLDIVAAYKATDAVTFALNADYARFFSNDGNPGGEIKGVAGYATFQLSSLIGLRGRVEYVNIKPDSVKSDSVKTFTGTVVVSPSSSFDILGEVRYDTDKKSYSIFPDGDDFDNSQGDIAVKVIYKF